MGWGRPVRFRLREQCGGTKQEERCDGESEEQSSAWVWRRAATDRPDRAPGHDRSQQADLCCHELQHSEWRSPWLSGEETVAQLESERGIPSCCVPQEVGCGDRQTESESDPGAGASQLVPAFAVEKQCAANGGDEEPPRMLGEERAAEGGTCDHPGEGASRATSAAGSGRRDGPAEEERDVGRHDETGRDTERLHDTRQREHKRRPARQSDLETQPPQRCREQGSAKDEGRQPYRLVRVSAERTCSSNEPRHGRWVIGVPQGEALGPERVVGFVWCEADDRSERNSTNEGQEKRRHYSEGDA